MPISTKSQAQHERPDVFLSGGSPFGQCINMIFQSPAVADLYKSMFKHTLVISDNLIARIAEADTELFLPDPMNGGQIDSNNPLFSQIIEQINPHTLSFSEDVYFDTVAYSKNPKSYLAGHPFIRKAIMQAQAAFLRSLFPYDVLVNIDSGFKGKGIPGFYLSQQRIKLSIYRSDWFYMSLSEIRDHIHAMVHRHTGILPDNTFCRMVKLAGIGMIDLIEIRSRSAVYRFCETNRVCQFFDDGQSFVYNGTEAYKTAQPSDESVTRFKYSSTKLSLRLEHDRLICNYLESPFAEVRILFNKAGFELEPIRWQEVSDQDTQTRILAFITKKMKKYGKTLPYQKYLTYEN